MAQLAALMFAAELLALGELFHAVTGMAWGSCVGLAMFVSVLGRVFAVGRSASIAREEERERTRTRVEDLRP